MKHFILLLLVIVFAVATANAQMNIGSNQAPDSSAMLQISGNTKGFLPPRMTRDTMLLIRNPAKGLIVFNTSDSALFMRRDTGWVKLFGAGTITSASVVTANGLTGTVANPNTAPAITLSTTVTGMVKGNGTALSAATSGADYAPGTAGNTTGIVKSTTGTGALTTAVAADFPTLNQNTTGNAATVTTNANLTGNVTSIGNTTTITNSAVTNAKMANMAANTFKANNTGSSIAPTDISVTQATAMLNPFTSTLKGLVPSSGGGTANFLRADGTFAVPPGTNTNAGTVTSVSVNSVNGVSGIVDNSTTTPAISLALGNITPTSVAATGAVTGSNLSGTNTGDETKATIQTKLGTASATTDGYLTQTDWNTFNSKATTTGTWSITGNAGINTATNFLGTTDLKSVRFRTNNLQRMILDSIGNVAIGTDTFDAANPEKFLINAGNTSSVNGLVTKGSIDNYFQMNIKNLSAGANATSDIVATADNGSETTNYVDLGINGSGYTGSTIQTGVANDGYLISSGNDFYMVNSSPNKNMLFLTGGTGVANERMRILANGRVGMGVQDPTAPFVVKDTMEIRRVGSLSQLLFTKTAGTGDFRIGGDGGDLFWQGGGGRGLQMGSYWTTILTGDRQTSTYPAFISSPANTGVLVLGQRDASVPLGIQANSATQSSNLTEWRNASGSVLSAVTKDGSFGIGLSNPSTKLHIVGTNPLTLMGVQTGTNTSADSMLTITSGLVRKLPLSTFSTASPTGTAGGDLAGSYPNPSLAASGVTANSYGNNTGTSYPYFTVDAKGRVTSATTQAISFPVTSVNSATGAVSLGISNLNDATITTPANNQLLQYNGARWVNTTPTYLSSAVTSLNSLTAASQTFAVGTAAGTGNSFNISSSGTIHTFNLPDASATVRGEITTGAQTIAGDKTLSGNTIVGGTLGVTGASTFTGAVTASALGSGAATDSIVTANASGLLRRRTLSDLSVGSWSTTGNSGTSYTTNFLGTKDNASLRFRANNIQGLIVDSLGNVGIGASPSFTAGTYREKFLIDAGTTTSYNPLIVKGSIDSFFQFNITNLSTGINASSDIVATSNAGTESTNYIDMGINGSGNTLNNFGNANDSYLYSSGQNLFIGTSTANKDIAFLTGGGTQSSGTTANNERMRINGTTGYVGIGTNSPTAPLHVASLTTVAGLTGIPTDVENIETFGLLPTDRANPPILNLVRQVNQGFYTSNAVPIGGVISFAMRTAGVKNDYAKIITQTSKTNSQIGFVTKTGLTNADPATGTLDTAMTINGANLGIGTTAPVSTLDVNGSVSFAIMTTSATTVSLDATQQTIILTGGTGTITLPSAGAASGRIYTIVNSSGSARTISNYVPFGATTATTSSIASATAMTIQSNGSLWYRIQ